MKNEWKNAYSAYRKYLKAQSVFEEAAKQALLSGNAIVNLDGGYDYSDDVIKLEKSAEKIQGQFWDCCIELSKSSNGKIENLVIAENLVFNIYKKCHPDTILGLYCEFSLGKFDLSKNNETKETIIVVPYDADFFEDDDLSWVE